MRGPKNPWVTKLIIFYQKYALLNSGFRELAIKILFLGECQIGGIDKKISSLYGEKFPLFQEHCHNVYLLLLLNLIVENNWNILFLG